MENLNRMLSAKLVPVLGLAPRPPIWETWDGNCCPVGLLNRRYRKETRMKKRWLVAMSACLLAAGVVHAQQKAYSVQVSNKIVHMEIQVPDGHWIKVAVQEGDQARITDRELELDMAFIPVRQDGGIRVRAFRIEKHQGGDESMHFVEEFDVNIGYISYTKKAAGTFAVKVIQVSAPPPDSSKGAAEKRGCSNLSGMTGDSSLDKLAGRCCVTCGSTTSCGCGVWDTCGSCCVGLCCSV
jgi:hypothetical protein